MLQVIINGVIGWGKALSHHACNLPIIVVSPVATACQLLRSQSRHGLMLLAVLCFTQLMGTQLLLAPAQGWTPRRM